MTLTSSSLMWVVMVQHKTSDQYLTSGKVSTRSIQGFKRYRLLKTLTKNFNILSNTYTDVDADMDAVAVVTAIALPVLTYRRANNVLLPWSYVSKIIRPTLKTSLLFTTRTIRRSPQVGNLFFFTTYMYEKNTTFTGKNCYINTDKKGQTMFNYQWFI